MEYATALANMAATGLPWVELSPGEREQLLKIFFNQGFAFGQLGQTDLALASYATALANMAATGLPWVELSPGEREQLLNIFFNQGVTFRQLGQTDLALASYATALANMAATGLSWVKLSPGEREPLLKIFSNQGFAFGQLGQTDQELASYARALHYLDTLSGLRWDDFVASEKLAWSAICLANVAQGRPLPQSLGFRLFVLSDPRVWGDPLLFDHYLPMQPHDLKGFAHYWLLHQGKQVCHEPVSLTMGVADTVLHNRQRHHTLERIHGQVFTPIADHTARLVRAYHQQLRHQAQQRRQRRIQRLLDRPGQSWWSRRKLRRILAGMETVSPAIFPNLEHFQRLCHGVAYDLAGVVMADHDLPDEPETLGEILLAGAYWGQAGVTADTETVWASGVPPWELDEAGFFQSLSLERLVGPGAKPEVESHQAWLAHLGGERLQQRRQAAPFQAWNTDWDEAILAWRQGEQVPLRQALKTAWAMLAVAAQRVAPQVPPSDWEAPLTRLLHALAPWFGATASTTAGPRASYAAGPYMPVYRAATVDVALDSALAFQQRLNRAQHALVGGTVRALLTETIEARLWACFQGLPPLEAATLPAWQGALRAMQDQVWQALPSPVPAARLQEVLQFMARAQTEQVLASLSGDLAEPTRPVMLARLWELLETGRLALAQVRLPARLPELDYEANQRLQGCLDAEWLRISNGIAAVRRGEPLPEEPDRSFFPPFDVLAAEYRRLGLTLPLPTPAQCAARLAADEALAQVAWDAEGQGHVLLLSPDGALRQVKLPGVTLADWRPLLAAWKAVYDLSLDETTWSLAHQEAWHAFVTAEGPALRLLTALVAASPEARRWTLLLPADLARLPWLAWPLAAEADRLPPVLRTPGALALEACLSAWEDEALAVPPAGGAQVLMESLHSNEQNADRRALAQALAQCEATAVAGRLGSRVLPTEEASLADALAMLRHGGPVHWVLHGEYRVHDPLASFVRLDSSQGCRELPIWLIAAHDCASPVTLSSCYAMLVGGEGTAEGGAPLLGPVGIGPILRAKGAPYVVGPLWQSNMLASAVFYEAFYQELAALGVRAAFDQAMATLKNMTAAALTQWAADKTLIVRHTVEAHIDNTGMRGDPTPFARPEFWAQFSLLGGREGAATAASKWQ